MTWRTLTERDCRLRRLNEVNPCDRDVWRFNVRSAMHAASQLPGGEPNDVDDEGTVQLISAFVFAIQIVQIPLIFKSKISSL